MAVSRRAFLVGAGAAVAATALPSLPGYRWTPVLDGRASTGCMVTRLWPHQLEFLERINGLGYRLGAEAYGRYNWRRA